MHMSRAWMLQVAGAGLLAGGLWACGSSGDGGGGMTESPDLGASVEKMVTAADGGEVALAEAGVKLSIPGGALAKDTMISAEVVSKMGLNDADTVVGNVVEFGPDGLTFDKPAMLELAVGDAKIPSNAKVSLAWYDEDNKAWVDLPGSSMADGMVVAETTHFTMFAIRFVIDEKGDLVQDAGECSGSFSACGGDPKGTWHIVSGCATFGDALGDINAGMECKGASLSLGVDITGDITFDGSMISGTLHVDAEVTTIMPKSCIGGSCPSSDASEPDAPVFVDKGDTCESVQSHMDTSDISEPYQVEGGMFMSGDSADASDGDMSEYCVSGNRLVVQTVNEDGVTMRWTAERK